MTSNNNKLGPVGIVGVSHLSDLYPNVKYKIAMLQEMTDARICFYDLGAGSLYGSVSQGNTVTRCLQRGKFLWGHLSVLTRCLWRREDIVYVTYPAVFILLGYSLLPRSRRPTLIMDAFLSLYDTVVNDRQMLAPSSVIARLLFRLEKRAFNTADVIVADTPDNGRHYRQLFAIASNKVTAIPLSIPDLPRQSFVPGQSDSGSFTCLFMGSLVPLQGIATLLAAIDLLKSQKRIRFEIIGDGQQAGLIQDYLNANPDGQLRWHRSLLATEALIDHIADADLCLGIFGDSAKADRVLPYKLYYYAAMGKAFLSRDSSCLRAVADPVLLCAADAESLAGRIVELSRSGELLGECAEASRRLFAGKLERRVQVEGLVGVLSGIRSHR